MSMLPALVAAALAVLALLTWIASRRARRQMVRRIGAVVSRLDERPWGGVDGGGGNLESALARLERTTDRINTRLTEARTEAEMVSGVLQAFTDGVVLADGSGRVILRNGVAEAFADARHGDALAEDAVHELLAEALAGRDTARELELFGPPRRTLEVRAVPLAHTHGAAVFIRDVSTVRRIDSVRRDFVANVSHELKTPIGALVALAEALEGDDDPDVMRRLAVRVRDEADRLARIVDDLLDLSLIEAQEAPERRPVPARTLLEEAADRVRGAAERAGVRLDVVEGGEGVMVPCDRRQVVSAIFNLLDNAVKYTNLDAGGGAGDGSGGGGACVQIGVEVEDGMAVIRVCDRGIGIPERDRERIFERFYRVDRARGRASGGTGLGLAIVRHVAQVHGGSVSVESEEGVGSTFSLLLPEVAGQ